MFTCRIVDALIWFHFEMRARRNVEVSTTRFVEGIGLEAMLSKPPNRVSYRDPRKAGQHIDMGDRWEDHLRTTQRKAHADGHSVRSGRSVQVKATHSHNAASSAPPCPRVFALLPHWASSAPLHHVICGP